VGKLSREFGIQKVWVILNKVDSTRIESFMREPLRGKKVEVLGSVGYDRLLFEAGLLGTPLPESTAAKVIKEIVGRLEAEI
jgi:CO dehydrogenase nickel-insertion accessory protein CooC1